MPDNKTVLGFDCSGPWCSIAIIRNGALLAFGHEDMAKGQAERLMPLILQTASQAELSLDQIDLIGVGVGPGNFTGTRIAVAAARGLALSLDIPAIGVGICEAVAHGRPRPCRAIVPARGDEVFWQDFMTDGMSDDGVNDAPDIGHLPSQTARDALPEGPQEVRLSGPIGPAIAFAAETRAKIAPWPRPAPIYLRAANAAPPSDMPPEILPE